MRTICILLSRCDFGGIPVSGPSLSLGHKPLSLGHKPRPTFGPCAKTPIPNAFQISNNETPPFSHRSPAFQIFFSPAESEPNPQKPLPSGLGPRPLRATIKLDGPLDQAAAHPHRGRKNGSAAYQAEPNSKLLVCSGLLIASDPYRAVPPWSPPYRKLTLPHS
jgi:hypothetical protein